MLPVQFIELIDLPWIFISFLLNYSPIDDLILGKSYIIYRSDYGANDDSLFTREAGCC